MTDTPPNAASVAIVREGKVLLIKRAYAPYQHLWTLPGGRIEPGETIEQCAIREIAEELGLTIRNPRPVMVQLLGRDEDFRLAVFATRDFSGQSRFTTVCHPWLVPPRNASRLCCFPWWSVKSCVWQAPHRSFMSLTGKCA